MVLPEGPSFFSKTDTDMDIRDDFRGTEGQVPVLRHNDQEWTPIQSMLYRGAVGAGFREDPDMNGPESSGVSTLPLDNSKCISMSAELTHLHPAAIAKT